MRWALACGLLACEFVPAGQPGGSPDIDATGTTDAAAPAALRLRIEADIDGRSNLIIRGTEVTWFHIQFAAPGRETFKKSPTKLDAVEWQPVWPDIPDAENRDCNCRSSTYAELPTALPRVPSTITVTHLLGRREVTPRVIEEPSAANDFTLTLEFDDVGLGGSAIYAAAIDVVPVQ